MLVLGLVVAGAVVALLAVLTRSMWVGWRRSEAQACVTEQEARENAAPLTTAMLSGSRERGRRGSSVGRDQKG
jgi:hypothetical protein